MKIVNYSGVKKTLEFVLKFKDDSSVFRFFDCCNLGFNCLKEIVYNKERRHIIQRIPEVVSVLDNYEYFTEDWECKLIDGKNLPLIGRILRETAGCEYELLVEFYPVMNFEKGMQKIEYNLLRAIGKIFDYSGYYVVIKNPNKIGGKPMYIWEDYMYSILYSVVHRNIDHYAVEDDNSYTMDDDE